MTEKQEKAIRRHGEQIQVIFPVAREIDAVELCRKLRIIESKAHRAAEQYCNGEINNDGWDYAMDTTLNRLDRLLRFKDAGVPVIVNGDARGYALKIESEYVAAHDLKIYRDWGGYGILAPEIGKDCKKRARST